MRSSEVPGPLPPGLSEVPVGPAAKQITSSPSWAGPACECPHVRGAVRRGVVACAAFSRASSEARFGLHGLRHCRARLAGGGCKGARRHLPLWLESHGGLATIFSRAGRRVSGCAARVASLPRRNSRGKGEGFRGRRGGKIGCVLAAAPSRRRGTASRTSARSGASTMPWRRSVPPRPAPNTDRPGTPTARGEHVEGPDAAEGDDLRIPRAQSANPASPWHPPAQNTSRLGDA